MFKSSATADTNGHLMQRIISVIAQNYFPCKYLLVVTVGRLLEYVVSHQNSALLPRNLGTYSIRRDALYIRMYSVL